MVALAAVSEATDSHRKSFAELKAGLAQAIAKPASLPGEGLIVTHVAELDCLLGGGFPTGIVATLEGERGGWSLAARLVARITRRSLAAILDDGTLYPPSLLEAGAHLERVLVVPARTALKIARAVDILLRSRICRLILMPAVALRDAVWMRLAKLARRSGALVLVIAARAGASLTAVARLRLRCAFERILVHGSHGLWGRVAGFKLHVDLCKHAAMMRDVALR